MYCVIVANAPDLDLTPHHELVQRAELRIAADGGALPLLRAGLLPHVVVGDLDSLDPHSQQELLARGVELQRFPRAKDETDFELALLLAAERGAQTIDVLGALGGRWDHTLANVALLAHPVLADRRVRLLDTRQALYLVRGQVSISGQPGDTISLIPLGGAAHAVTTRGLLYPLQDAVLHFEQARGISNVLLEPPALVQVGQGLLLVVQHDDGGAYQWNTTEGHREQL